MFAEQIHSRIVLNNLSRKKEYFVIAFYITSFPQLFYPLMTRQFFCDFHEKSEDFCVS